MSIFAEYEEGWCITFKHISGASDIPEARVRKIVRHLKRKGLVDLHHGLFTEDGEMWGSGHCLNKQGRAVWAIAEKPQRP